MHVFRSVALSLTIAAGVVAQPGLTSNAAVAQPAAQPGDWGQELWEAASNATETELLDMLGRFAPDSYADRPGLVSTVAALQDHLAERETLRAERLAELEEELTELLEAEPTPNNLSDALRVAVAMSLVRTDKEGLLREPRIIDLIAEAADAAYVAEENRDWLDAAELFGRLEVLLENQQRFEEEVRRSTRRLELLRLYAPQRLWELRNERRLEEELEALPPYNETGDSYEEKLNGVSVSAVANAIYRATLQHVEHISLNELLVGGLRGVRTMITTPDLAPEFPGIENDAAKESMLSYLRLREDALTQAATISADDHQREIAGTIRGLLDKNSSSVRLPAEVIAHEFGIGAMDAIMNTGDRFSSIIWPHEVRRFERSTQGSFIGVGIQIQLDEAFNIKVVTPLEGTPAQRAGIQADDIITKVDGKSTAGFTLDQAVDVITGPPGEVVSLTVERSDLEGNVTEIEKQIKRQRIELRSVKGWRRVGKSESDWDWFISRDEGIAYIRLTGFAENTTAELDQAIAQMRRRDLQGVILDLRYNPGGLLDQAVEVANRFIPTRGVIVQTRDEVHEARLGKATLADVPLVVLVNEGSASASEIVSGAIREYAAKGEVDALIVGQRSYGKGSVQNVWQLPPYAGEGRSFVKLTTQYYKLPSGRVIHRKPGSLTWGVDPNLPIEMLPSQQTDAIVLRRDADVRPLDENGEIKSDYEAPDPDDLLRNGVDLQLETALVLLQGRADVDSPGRVMREETGEVRSN